MNFSRKGTRPRMFHPHARVIIFNVLRFMAKEAQSGSNLIALHKVEERVAMATGISRRTLSRIKKEFKNSEEAANKSKSQTYVKPKIVPYPQEATEYSRMNPNKVVDDKNGSTTSLPQIIMHTQETVDCDADESLPEILIKAEMETVDTGGCMVSSGFMKIEESEAESVAKYRCQNIELPELIIKSENESDDSDMDYNL